MLRGLHFYKHCLWSVALLSLGGAFVAEKFGVRPCLLCIYQRYLWGLLGALALLATVSPWKNKSWLPLFFGFYCLSMTGFATYQVLIEEKFIEAPRACRASSFQAKTVEELWNSMDDKPLAPCDAPPLKFLGLSLAAYGGATAALLAMICFASWFFSPPLHRNGRRRHTL